jgi:hypothetical protein
MANKGKDGRHRDADNIECSKVDKGTNLLSATTPNNTCTSSMKDM